MYQPAGRQRKSHSNSAFFQESSLPLSCERQAQPQLPGHHWCLNCRADAHKKMTTLQAEQKRQRTLRELRFAGLRIKSSHSHAGPIAEGKELKVSASVRFGDSQSLTRDVEQALLSRSQLLPSAASDSSESEDESDFHPVMKRGVTRCSTLTKASKNSRSHRMLSTGVPRMPSSAGRSMPQVPRMSSFGASQSQDLKTALSSRPSAALTSHPSAHSDKQPNPVEAADERGQKSELETCV